MGTLRLMKLKMNRSGVMLSTMEETTVQKYDMQFGTNVIGKSRVLLSLAFLPYDGGSLPIYRPLALHKALVARTFCSH
jgi:hypothetical protein